MLNVEFGMSNVNGEDLIYPNRVTGDVHCNQLNATA